MDDLPEIASNCAELAVVAARSRPDWCSRHAQPFSVDSRCNCGIFCGLAPVRPARRICQRFATPGEMRSGALLLKSENDRLRRGPAARHRRRSHGVRPDHRAPASRRSSTTRPRLGRGGLRLSAARRRRRRHPEDGDRRAHHRRRHQGAAAGARRSTSRPSPPASKASLIEQERPNIFTNSVANIGPGETVLVQIEYQEPVRQSGDEFSLRVPLVVAPRYNPEPIVQTVDLASGRAAAGARPSPTRCPTATASRRRCSIRASTRRSIRSPSRCACRPASRSAR